MVSLLLALSLTLGSQGQRAASTCQTDFDSLTVWIEKDYPLYNVRRKEKPGELGTLEMQIAALVKDESNTPRCTALLREYVSFFSRHDPRIDVWQILPPKKAPRVPKSGRLLPSGLRRVSIPHGSNR